MLGINQNQTLLNAAGLQAVFDVASYIDHSSPAWHVEPQFLAIAFHPAPHTKIVALETCFRLKYSRSNVKNFFF
jgi:hypothetical protein